mgnify:CR=1 FL=1
MKNSPWQRMVGVFLCTVATISAAQVSADEAAANPMVLKLIDRMPTGGGYEWESTGVPHTIRHKGKVVLKKTSADGTYCSGVTFTVAMEAAKRSRLIRDKSFEEIKTFQRQWYGTNEVSAETQCVYALEQLGIGYAVEHDDAQAGDFLQFWRGKSGHSVIFLAWETDDQGNRVGIRYWSTQTATDGIGVHTEYFNNAEGFEGSVDPNRVYLGRMSRMGEDRD